MKKKRFTEEQIVGILHEAVDRTTREVCRKHGITETTSTAVLRLYREERLAVRRQRRQKRVAVARVPLPVAAERNERWSMDFVSDDIRGDRHRDRDCVNLPPSTIGGAHRTDNGAKPEQRAPTCRNGRHPK